jgi:hypothetical protein
MGYGFVLRMDWLVRSAPSLIRQGLPAEWW